MSRDSEKILASAYEPSVPLGSEQKALVAALTEAILSARQDVPPPNSDATAAATQYGQIKGALRTHSEPIPTASTSNTSKG